MLMDRYSGSSFDIYQLLALTLPVASSVVTWLGARKRDNDFLADLQKSLTC